MMSVSIEGATIQPCAGADWRPLLDKTRDFVAEWIHMFPRGRRTEFNISCVIGDDDAWDQWLELVSHGQRYGGSHVRLIPHAQPSKTPEPPSLHLWLADVVLDDLNLAPRLSVGPSRSMRHVAGSFLSRGTLHWLPQRERLPILVPPAFPWLAAAEEGDWVYLPKFDAYAQLETGLLWYPSRMHRIVLSRHYAAGPRTELWYVDAYGRGFDGSYILQPVQGWIRETGITIPDTRALPSQVAQARMAPERELRRVRVTNREEGGE